MRSKPALMLSFISSTSGLVSSDKAATLLSKSIYNGDARGGDAEPFRSFDAPVQSGVKKEGVQTLESKVSILYVRKNFRGLKTTAFKLTRRGKRFKPALRGNAARS